ncbi:archease [Ferroplasma sp.]|uniref:archease n=1 Tax=Ferroplasma sp. TaxID=2591003 RepID=UPI0026316683|nr:archease [Ferroplasma sp.]MCL4453395.1 archease [Candidatus Thermoplasmatota archaeon]
MIYDVLDHTADLKVRIYGNSYTSIFQNSVITISDLIMDRNLLKPGFNKTIEIEKNSPDNILVNLLNDILFYMEYENVIYFGSKLDFTENRLHGRIFGSSIPDNVEYRNVIKAATYYDLKVDPEHGFAMVVFDI